MEWNSEPVEAKIGINFKNSEILYLALSHRSYAQQISEPDNDNERLEFLGEAILNVVAADYLYHHCPYLEVANLSALRDKLLERERRTKLWFQLGLGEAYPFLGLAEQRHRLRQQPNNPFESGFEALVGAIYLDRGFSQTRNWLVKNLIAPLLERHLKDLKERLSPNKQLRFLGDALLKAIASDYLYRHLPYVSERQLTQLYKEIISNEQQSEYLSHLIPEDLAGFNLEQDIIRVKSFKVLLGAIYIECNTLEERRGFSKTSEWFSKCFIDDDEILRKAIALLLEDGKAQKWIIRHVMGYESKDYNEGRDRFNAIIAPSDA